MDTQTGLFSKISHYAYLKFYKISKLLNNSIVCKKH